MACFCLKQVLLCNCIIKLFDFAILLFEFGDIFNAKVLHKAHQK